MRILQLLRATMILHKAFVQPRCGALPLSRSFAPLLHVASPPPHVPRQLRPASLNRHVSNDSSAAFLQICQCSTVTGDADVVQQSAEAAPTAAQSSSDVANGSPSDAAVTVADDASSLNDTAVAASIDSSEAQTASSTSSTAITVSNDSTEPETPSADSNQLTGSLYTVWDGFLQALWARGYFKDHTSIDQAAAFTNKRDVKKALQQLGRSRPDLILLLPSPVLKQFAAIPVKDAETGFLGRKGESAVRRITEAAQAGKGTGQASTQDVLRMAWMISTGQDDVDSGDAPETIRNVLQCFLQHEQQQPQPELLAAASAAAATPNQATVDKIKQATLKDNSGKKDRKHREGKDARDAKERSEPVRAVSDDHKVRVLQSAPYRQLRANDWFCGQCGAHNFSTNSTCFKCAVPINSLGNSKVTLVEQRQLQQLGLWGIEYEQREAAAAFAQQVAEALAGPRMSLVEAAKAAGLTKFKPDPALAAAASKQSRDTKVTGAGSRKKEGEKYSRGHDDDDYAERQEQRNTSSGKWEDRQHSKRDSRATDKQRARYQSDSDSDTDSAEWWRRDDRQQSSAKQDSKSARQSSRHETDTERADVGSLPRQQSRQQRGSSSSGGQMSEVKSSSSSSSSDGDGNGLADLVMSALQDAAVPVQQRAAAVRATDGTESGSSAASAAAAKSSPVAAVRSILAKRAPRQRLFNNTEDQIESAAADADRSRSSPAAAAAAGEDAMLMWGKRQRRTRQSEEQQEQQQQLPPTPSRTGRRPDAAAVDDDSDDLAGWADEFGRDYGSRSDRGGRSSTTSGFRGEDSYSRGGGRAFGSSRGGRGSRADSSSSRRDSSSSGDEYYDGYRGGGSSSREGGESRMDDYDRSYRGDRGGRGSSRGGRGSRADSNSRGEEHYGGYRGDRGGRSSSRNDDYDRGFRGDRGNTRGARGRGRGDRPQRNSGPGSERKASWTSIFDQ